MGSLLNFLLSDSFGAEKIQILMPMLRKALKIIYDVLVEENRNIKRFNPLLDMSIVGSSNSAANKDMM